MHNFEPKALMEKVAELEAKSADHAAALEVLAPLFPLVPVLLEKYSGETAGIGATQESATAIPAGELGQYKDETKA